MRYLRKFNESTNDDLQSFCEDNLAYLIDEGFKVKVEESYFKRAKITIHKFSFPIWTKFTWDDVKDDVIPFLEILKDKYGFFEDIKFVSEDQHYNYLKHFLFKYDDVINDSFTLNQDSKDFDKIVRIELTLV